MFILNFILGIFIVAFGVVLMKMNYKFTNLFSRNNLFERKLGPGSSYTVALVFSVLVMLIGFLVMFSLHDDVLDFFLSPVIDAFSL